MQDLVTNPQQLPYNEPFPGAPLKTYVKGHGPLIDKDMDDVRALRDEYSKKCGPPAGPPAVPSPARGPARVPVPKPGNVRPNRVPLPLRPAPAVIPFFVIPPGFLCVFMPEQCGGVIA